MTTLDFVALTLAASGLVHLWFRGNLFDGPRAYVQVRSEAPLDDLPIDAADDAQEDSSWWMRLADRVLPNFACELLTCPLCLSQHVPWILGLLCLAPAWLLLEVRHTRLEAGGFWFLCTGALAWLLKLPLYSFAAARLGHLLTAIIPAPEIKYEDDDA